MNKLMIVILVLLALVACNAPAPTAAPSAPTSAPNAPTIAPTIAPTVRATDIAPTSAPTTVRATAPRASPTIQLSNPPTKQPNILFILTDDLDAASIQYMPKLKSLVTDQGTTFTNFFISMPLCCPSRAAILRGQYGHNTQILGNTEPSGGFQKFFRLDEEKSTIATWLQSAGYRTMLAGKYLNGFPDRSNLMYIPPGWTEWYSAMKGNAYGSYNYTLNENGKQVAYGNTPADYGTDVYARKTVELIERATKEGKPFFAYVSVYVPHSPATPAPRHANLFADAKAPRPPNYNEEDVSDKPNYIRLRPKLTNREITRIDEEHRKRLQSLQAVDDLIETVINSLKQTGQLDNTYIFFTSDNGFHLGNHRQVTGKVAPYEEEIRVTMIARGPGVPAGKTLEHLTGNIDLAPTFAELAGAKIPDFVDGRSLAPLLKNNPPTTSAWRQCFLIENGLWDAQAQTRAARQIANTPPELLEPPDADDENDDATPTAQARQLGVPAYRGIRTRDSVYIEYITGEKELYDLTKDPYQLQNLAATADKTLLAQLAARLTQMKTCVSASCRTIENVAIGK
ncbi:MAG: sulfatase [Chloroflexi bacterium]|nr:sulfatase [Chloroflexota bacterium]